MQKTVVISGTGGWAPTQVISNEELVASFNAYVQQHNTQYAAEIANGQRAPLAESSAEFIVKASGIRRRHVIDKAGILDIARMKPQIAWRPDADLSFHSEFALPAVRQALTAAGKSPHDIDAIIVSCTNIQRPYPAIAIELQNYLGCSGYAFDMHAACSSATFGVQTAYHALLAGQATAVLVVTAEIATPQVNFRDRDSHFIFGDAVAAAVLETTATCQVNHPYRLVDSKLLTQFSNNIRSNDGFLRRVENGHTHTGEDLFSQQGRAVFKEVVPLASKFMQAHLQQQGLEAKQVQRFWLHQANINMNQLIMHKLLGRDATAQEAPLILDEYANTAGAGALLAFHLHHADLASGEWGLLCSFGAGYSIGSIILQHL